MKRRNFIRAALATGLGSRVLSTEAKAETETSLRRTKKKPIICFYHDGRHPLVYVYEPPMQKEEYEAAVDELVGTPIEAIMFGLGDGRTLLHDTKVGELWGHWVKKWSSLIYRRAYQNAIHLIKEGHDPLRIICDRAHEKGLLVYPTLFMNLGRGNRETDVRGSLFRFNNTHLEIGAGGGVDPNFPGLYGLDFKHDEVRQERFTIIEETLHEYPVDGFELDLDYMPYYFLPDEVEEGRKIMTAFIEQIYQAVKQSDSDRELAVRIPASLATCFSRGLDVRDWIRRGIVDLFIGQSPTRTQIIDQTLDLRPLVQAAKGSKCRVLADCKHLIDSDRLADSTIQSTRAAACNYWAQGVDGLLLDQWFGMWPYQGAFYEQVREIPYPDLMATKDKHYFLPTIGIEYKERRLGMQLPQDLHVNQPVRVEWTITDDLLRWHKKGRVHEVLLRARLVNHTEIDRLEFRLNGKRLPESQLRKINRMYKMSAPRYRVFGYWFVWKLNPSHWPKRGQNRLLVTVTYRDPALTPQLILRDVELDIQYLLGKNFHRGQDPDLGPYEHRVT